MSTFLFSQIIFGPVKSRRLGESLGINLLPNDSKFCNFNCIYCECGWTPGKGEFNAHFHPWEDVKTALEEKLKNMRANNETLDVITFAGNGEPTLHPAFSKITEFTIQLRDTYFPDAEIAVLSNGTMLHKNSVFNALSKIDQNILKLDSVYDSTINIINQPLKKISASTLIKQYKSFTKTAIIQTLFVQGYYKGYTIDNTTNTEVTGWLEALREINPRRVMVYTISRDTPTPTLRKVPEQRLQEIANEVRKLGIEVNIAG